MSKLSKDFRILVEKDAGVYANFKNNEYEKSGAEISTASDVLKSDIVLKVRAPSEQELSQMKEKAMLISHIFPDQNKTLVDKMVSKGITSFAMDKIPRISRA